MSIHRRLARLEAATSEEVTHDDAVLAMDRIDRQPPDYTDEQREADHRTLKLYAAKLIEVGLIDPEDYANATA